MRKWNIPLTYGPKETGVRTGTCRQTIRAVGKGGHKRVGDLISFHGWAGRPYWSSWSWRTPYTPITDVWGCLVLEEGILWFDTQGKDFWRDLDYLAAFDGIVPPTGEALRDVLMSKNKIPFAGIEAQVIRW